MRIILWLGSNFTVWHNCFQCIFNLSTLLPSFFSILCIWYSLSSTIETPSFSAPLQLCPFGVDFVIHNTQCVWGGESVEGGLPGQQVNIKSGLTWPSADPFTLPKFKFLGDGGMDFTSYVMLTVASFFLHSDPRPEQSLWFRTLWGRSSGFHQRQPVRRSHLHPGHRAHGERDGLSANAHQTVQNFTCFLLERDVTAYSFCYAYNLSFMGNRGAL